MRGCWARPRVGKGELVSFGDSKDIVKNQPSRSERVGLKHDSVCPLEVPCGFLGTRAGGGGGQARGRTWRISPSSSASTGASACSSSTRARPGRLGSMQAAPRPPSTLVGWCSSACPSASPTQACRRRLGLQGITHRSLVVVFVVVVAVLVLCPAVRARRGAVAPSAKRRAKCHPTPRRVLAPCEKAAVSRTQGGNTQPPPQDSGLP